VLFRSRLFHTPAAMLINATTFDQVEEAFAKGVSDLLPYDADPAEIARRVVSLARERRRREMIKSAFAQVRTPEARGAQAVSGLKAISVVDAATGLATPQFFSDHFDNMARRAHHLERPLSAIIVRTTTPDNVPELERDLALRQIGSMVGRLMRAEDFAAQLEPGVFAVAMPGAARSAAEGAAHRIAAVAECTAFGGGTSADAFQVELRCEVGELAPDESAGGLLARTVKAFDRMAPRSPEAAKGY